MTPVPYTIGLDARKLRDFGIANRKVTFNSRAARAFLVLKQFGPTFGDRPLSQHRMERRVRWLVGHRAALAAAGET